MFTDLSSDLFIKSDPKRSWALCYQEGAWRYFDPATDKWEKEDGSPNEHLHVALKVISAIFICGFELTQLFVVCTQERRKNVIEEAKALKKEGKRVDEGTNFRSPYNKTAMAMYHQGIFNFMNVSLRQNMSQHPYERAEGKLLKSYDCKFKYDI